MSVNSKSVQASQYGAYMKRDHESRLSTATLLELERSILRPAYERASLRPHTVHIGVGGFHRAHQAVYLDDLLNAGDVKDWGECGIGVMASDIAMRDALAEQDYLYTVLERSADTHQARVIGSMIDYVYAPENPDNAIERLANAETHLVSLTITEGGYFIQDTTGVFSVDHPDIQHDIRCPEKPVTSLGYITAALKLRRDRGLGPFTLMSCDNLQGNGHVLRKVITGLAEQQDPALKQWILDHVAFPNSMVDRITPATTGTDRAFLLERYGYVDAWPVVTEPFRQWVIEDEFCNRRPAWEVAGAELVSDVAPYELMKMRLLNASHMAMAYLGALAGLTYAHEVMLDPVLLGYIRSFMEEVTPVVPVIPGTSIPEYKSTLIERFSNPTIMDQISRLCSEGSAKLPKWIFPSIRELAASGQSIKLISLTVASWICYLQTDFDERGKPITVVDANAKELKRLARAAGTHSASFLSDPSIFGEEMAQLPTLAGLVDDSMTSLRTIGTNATLSKLRRIHSWQAR
jgi:mannitol 2-dehydrogenase